MELDAPFTTMSVISQILHEKSDAGSTFPGAELPSNRDLGHFLVLDKSSKQLNYYKEYMETQKSDW